MGDDYFFDLKIMFDERERVAKARLEEVLKVVPDRPSPGTAGEEGSFVVVKGQEVVPSTFVGHDVHIKAIRPTATVGTVMPTSVLPFVRDIRHRLLGVVKASLLLSMH